MTEAMAFFQVVVAHHERKGDSKATFATLKKMVDLDPENVSSRLKLAELYAREQMGGEALAEFKRAADWLERNNRPDERLRVLERIASLEPDNVQLARSLAHDYLARGDHKRAQIPLCRRVKTTLPVGRAGQRGQDQAGNRLPALVTGDGLVGFRGDDDGHATSWY